MTQTGLAMYERSYQVKPGFFSEKGKFRLPGDGDSEIIPFPQVQECREKQICTHEQMVLQIGKKVRFHEETTSYLAVILRVEEETAMVSLEDESKPRQISLRDIGILPYTGGYHPTHWAEALE